MYDNSRHNECQLFIDCYIIIIIVIVEIGCRVVAGHDGFSRFKPIHQRLYKCVYPVSFRFRQLMALRVSIICNKNGKNASMHSSFESKKRQARGYPVSRQNTTFYTCCLIYIRVHSSCSLQNFVLVIICAQSSRHSTSWLRFKL